MVGNRQRIHPQFLDVANQLGKPVGAVKQRIFTVGVQVDKGHGSAGRRSHPGIVPALGEIVKSCCPAYA
jgi:hypothetical protein